jgi:hypothetical protein
VDHEQSAPGVDHETGLPDGVGWNAVLEAEELRIRRYGGTHGLIVVQLTVPPDVGSVHKVAHALAGAIRDIDLLARIDQATFAVLALHCDDLTSVVSRIHGALDTARASSRSRVDAMPAGADLRGAWAVLTAERAAPAISPARHLVDFVARSGFSLN